MAVKRLDELLLNVPRVLALIQSRLDTIDARVASLASQLRMSK